MCSGSSVRPVAFASDGSSRSSGTATGRDAGPRVELRVPGTEGQSTGAAGDASGGTADDRAHRRGPPPRPTMRGRDPVRVEVTSDLSEALAGDVLAADPLHDGEWRSSGAVRRCRLRPS